MIEIAFSRSVNISWAVFSVKEDSFVSSRPGVCGCHWKASLSIVDELESVYSLMVIVLYRSVLKSVIAAEV